MFLSSVYRVERRFAEGVDRGRTFSNSFSWRMEPVRSTILVYPANGEIAGQMIAEGRTSGKTTGPV